MVHSYVCFLNFNSIIKNMIIKTFWKYIPSTQVQLLALDWVVSCSHEEEICRPILSLINPNKDAAPWSRI